MAYIADADIILRNLRRGLLPKNHKEREVVLQEYQTIRTIPDWCKIVRLIKAIKPWKAHLVCSGHEAFNGKVSLVANGEILKRKPTDSALVLYTHGCRFDAFLDGKQFTSWVLAEEMPGCGKKTWFPRKAMELAEGDGNIVKLTRRYLQGYGDHSN